MWLLSTDRAELHFFVSPEAVQGTGYAILSHVWDAEEQTLEDIQELRRRCNTTGENPRELACEKIKRCCELAERHGFKWVWIDTCCIDKTSSAELSEAINSMFRYYSLAAVCYAFLKDVPTKRALTALEPPFRKSCWHTRSWTLQELIAPRTVVFLSCNWIALGSKVDLAASLELQTGIPAGLLRLEENISEFSIAQRMSWAANRTATRVEDEAYSLLGIFDIMMPTLYGEGRKAFRRLQEEIMRQSPDPTIFGWGIWIVPSLMARTSLNWQVLNEPPPYERESHLFAHRPSAFLECGWFTYASHFEPANHERGKETSSPESFSLTSRQLMDDTISFAITPSGVLAHILVADLHAESGLAFADLGITMKGTRFFLILLRRPHTPSRSYPAYHVGARNRIDQYYRLVQVETNESVDFINWPIASTSEASWEWKDVYLLHNVPTPTHRVPGIPPIPMNHSLQPHFRFPDANIRVFMESLRFGNRFFRRVQLASVRNVQVPVADTLPVSFVFSRGERLRGQSADNFAIVISVGQCAARNLFLPPTSKGTQPVHRAPSLLWAHARCCDHDGDLATCARHNCAEDHVSTWQSMEKAFTCGEYRGKWESLQITLSFAPCSLNPGTTLVLNASAEVDLTLTELPGRARGPHDRHHREGEGPTRSRSYSV